MQYESIAAALCLAHAQNACKPFLLLWCDVTVYPRFHPACRTICMEPAALESVTRTRRRGILRFSAAGLGNRCCFPRACGRFQPRRPLSAKRSLGYLQAFLHRLLLRLPVYIPIPRQPMNTFILYPKPVFVNRYFAVSYRPANNISPFALSRITNQNGLSAAKLRTSAGRSGGAAPPAIAAVTAAASVPLSSTAI